MKKKTVDAVLLGVLLSGLTAGAALLFTDTKSAWYLSLNQPAIQPPPLVFMIVWTLVYVLFAASVAVSAADEENGTPWALYLLQGVLNAAWCLAFFKLHLLYVGFGLIVAYLVVTYLTIRQQKNRTAGWLLVPQTVWLVAAAALNYLTILLN